MGIRGGKGNSVAVTAYDTSKVLKQFKLYGKSEQEQTSGAQLLELEANTASTASGLSISIKDSYIITVSGTPNAVWANLTNFDTKKIPQGKYTFAIDKKPTELGIDLIGIKFRKSMDTSDNVTYLITGSNKSITFDRLDDYEFIQIYAEGLNASKTYNFTIKVMLNEGETALPFEKYTGGKASPNPDYPQEVKVVDNPVSISFEYIQDSIPTSVASLLILDGNLVGIPVATGGNIIDSNGQRWVCDEIDKEAGKRIQRVGVEVFDGSDDENWKASVTSVSGKYRNTTSLLKNLAKPYDITVIGNLLCTHYKAVASNSSGTWGAKQGMCIDGSSTVMVYDENFNTEDISLWKAHLQANPMTVYYELAEPIITDLTESEMSQLNGNVLKFPASEGKISANLSTYLEAVWETTEDCITAVRDNVPQAKMLVPYRTDSIYQGDGYNNCVYTIFKNVNCSTLTVASSVETGANCSGTVTVRGDAGSGYVTLAEFDVGERSDTINISPYKEILVILDRTNGGVGTEYIHYIVG